MRHPIEIFDTRALGRMAAALDAAVRTVRLTGTEPDDTIRWEMARRILSAASDGASTPLALAEAALDGRWISDHLKQGSHAEPTKPESGLLQQLLS